jgi:DNA-binding PadR family transcriptional regulator
MALDETPGPLTPAVFHVLLALSDEALHGYAIMKRVETDSGLGMGPGTIYGSLDRLRDAGWVSEESSVAGDTRRGRSFALTTLGRNALRAEARRLARLAELAAVRGAGAAATS